MGHAPASAEDFDKLPDSSFVRIGVLTALFAVSPASIWRWSRQGRLPCPTKVSGTTLWSVRDLREVIADLQNKRDRPTEAEASADAHSSPKAMATRSVAPGSESLNQESDRIHRIETTLDAGDP